MAWVRLPGAAEKGIVCLQLTVATTALTRCVVSRITGVDIITYNDTQRKRSRRIASEMHRPHRPGINQ